MAHPKHQDVRIRYQYQCGYCGVSESETGGELTVDHFCPVITGGDDSDDNLVYSCFRCNLYKSDFHPTADDLQHGRRLLHLTMEDSNSHLHENPKTGHLEAKTNTGQFHIDLLRLNRPQLVEKRPRHRLAKLLRESHDMLKQENRILREKVVAMASYLQFLLSQPLD